jgi:hypothetical protein
MAKYKNKILNVKPKHNAYENVEEMLIKDQNDNVYTKYFDELDGCVLGTNLQFLYKDKFVKINGKSKDKLFYILLPISLIVAIVCLFI